MWDIYPKKGVKKGLKEAPILGLSILRKICCERSRVQLKNPIIYTRPLETHIAFDFLCLECPGRRTDWSRTLDFSKSWQTTRPFVGLESRPASQVFIGAMEVSKLRNMENLHPVHSQKSLQWVPSRELTHLGSKVSWRVFKPLLLGSWPWYNFNPSWMLALFDFSVARRRQKSGACCY